MVFISLSSLNFIGIVKVQIYSSSNPFIIWIENETEYSILLNKIFASKNKLPSNVTAEFVFLITKLETISWFIAESKIGFEQSA